MPKVFLSFRRSDSTAIAGRIYDRLIHRYGSAHVRNDIGYIRAAVKPADYVAELISNFDVVVVVVGPNWADLTSRDGKRRLEDPNDPVLLEIGAAAQNKRPIIVVLVRGAVMPSEDKLPAMIKTFGRRQALVFGGDVSFNSDMRALYREIDDVIEASKARVTPTRNEGIDPDTARQAELRAWARENINRGAPPFSGRRIETLGEVNWLLGTRDVVAGATDRPLTDLTGADLSYINLANGTLDGINLAGADLTGANLTCASLREAHLNGAKLTNADLTGVYAEAADLAGADLSKAVLSAAHLSGAKLTGAKLQGARLNEADLSNTDLQEVDLTDGLLVDSTLAGASLIQAILTNASLKRAVLESATLDLAQLENADLTSANLTSARLVGSNLTQTNLSRACLINSDMSDAHYGETDFSDAQLAGAKLDAAEDILGKIKFGLDVSLDQVAWNGVQTHIDSTGKSTAMRIGRYRDVARVNRRIATVLRGLSMQAEASKYRLKEQNAQRKILFLQRKYGAWLFSGVLNVTAGYGDRLTRTVLAYLIVVFSFATIYYTMTQSLPDPGAHLAWQDAILLSIHSFHGRGFIPSTLGLSDPLALVATVEAILGLFLELVFIAVFSRRFLGS